MGYMPKYRFTRAKPLQVWAWMALATLMIAMPIASHARDTVQARNAPPAASAPPAATTPAAANTTQARNAPLPAAHR